MLSHLAAAPSSLLKFNRLPVPNSPPLLPVAQLIHLHFQNRAEEGALIICRAASPGSDLAQRFAAGAVAADGLLMR